MSVTISMDKAGRIVLPKSLRDRYRLKEGAKLRVEMVGDHLELTPEDREDGPPVVQKKGLLVVSVTGASCDAAEAVRADREDREAAITKNP
jgi:AbrB family looped-hinge helix DNA binding protein